LPGLKKLPRSFYLRPTVVVARELLGKYLVRIYKGQRLIGTIVEAEAYCEGDPASHSYIGRTKRNDVMFWEGGHLYVYFTYGMHFCANVVTRNAGIGEAVLIRAVEPVQEIDVMIRNRRASHSKKSAVELTNGPAKLCQALCIGRKENGIDLLGKEVFILDAPRLPSSSIRTSTRIGITDGKGKKWRYFVKRNGWVSR
jgi:DNA-3-methyladenine glycosylase